MYFSLDPNGDGYTEHTTEAEAKQAASVALEAERNEALTEGWDEAVGDICWGKIIGRTFLKKPIYVEDSDYELRKV
jgi:hypothetical protein